MPDPVLCPKCKKTVVSGGYSASCFTCDTYVPILRMPSGYANSLSLSTPVDDGKADDTSKGSGNSGGTQPIPIKK